MPDRNFTQGKPIVTQVSPGIAWLSRCDG
jgi:hypothetical protein